MPGSLFSHFGGKKRDPGNKVGFGIPGRIPDTIMYAVPIAYSIEVFIGIYI